MADIRINELETLSPSAIDGSYYAMVFTSDGDTNKVVFQDAVAQANENNGCVCLQTASLTIATADVLQLNSTPLTIVAAQGAGTVIEVISAFMKMTYNSATYATNVGLAIGCSGADEPQVISATALNASASSIRKLAVDSTFAATDTQIIENTALEVYVLTGDPTTGDSDITVHVLYRVITL